MADKITTKDQSKDEPEPSTRGTAVPPAAEAILGTGGELYGDAHTTPDDALVNYPSDQDGVAIAPPDVVAPPEDVINPTDLTAGSPATLK